MNRVPKFKGVAVGGTFDPFHRGHRELLTKAFKTGEKVFIGVISDKFSKSLGKKLEDTYEGRVSKIKTFVNENFPDSMYLIGMLDDYVGPVVVTGEVDAIVVTKETEGKVETANRLRREKNLKPLSVVRIPIVLAENGQRISSTRIKRLEIDEEGTIIKNHIGQ